MAESLHILLGTSACHSGKRTVARGPLVLICHKKQDLTFLANFLSWRQFA